MIPREQLERWRELPEIDRRAQELIDKSGFQDNYTDRARAADRMHKARNEAIAAMPILIAEVEAQAKEIEASSAEIARLSRLLREARKEIHDREERDNPRDQQEIER